MSEIWPTVVLAVIFFVIIGLILTFMILLVKAKLVSQELITLTINDELKKEAESGTTLLNTLLAQGFGIPSPCGGKATCLQCKVRVVEGGGEILQTDRSTFKPKELKDGWRLSCQCKIRQDMKILLPPSAITLNEFEARVVSNKNVATFIKELVIEVPQDTELEYIPGDYMQIKIPPYVTNTTDWKKTIDPKYFPDWEMYGMFGNEIKYEPIEDVIRAFSMASHPLEGKLLKFNVRIATPPMKNNRLKKGIPWGIASSYIFSLDEGDKVLLSGPFGESHMVDDDRELIFLIGGAGSSFGRSHILDLFEAKKTKRKVTLWYGARSLRENIYEEDFKRLDENYDNFTYHVVLSEPLPEDFNNGWPKDDPLKTNFVYKAFEKGQLEEMETPEDNLYYVCGPPMHNKSVMKLLDDYGVLRDNIILDDFGS